MSEQGFRSENQSVKVPHFHICKRLPKSVIEAYS